MRREFVRVAAEWLLTQYRADALSEADLSVASITAARNSPAFQSAELLSMYDTKTLKTAMWNKLVRDIRLHIWSNLNPDELQRFLSVEMKK